jgi:hypothetical protein
MLMSVLGENAAPIPVALRAMEAARLDLDAPVFSRRE